MAALIFLVALKLLLWPCNPQQGWGGDYAGYLGQARQVVEGNPLSETYYIYNPALPYLAPPAYPMGFSLVLAPIYAISGLDLTLFVRFVTFTWWCSGMLLFLLSRRHFSLPVSLGISMIWLFNPYMFAAKNGVLPDHLFTCWMLLAIYWYAHKDRSSLKNALICGVFAGLAWITRANGVVLLLAFGADVLFGHLSSWIKERKWHIDTAAWKNTGITIAVAIVIQLLTHQVFFRLPEGGSYFDQLVYHDNLSKIFQSNLDANFAILIQFFLPTSPLPFDLPTKDIAMQLGGIVALGAVMTGLIVASGPAFRFYRILAAGFVAVLVIWPMAQSLRYIAPVIPVLFLFGAEGIRRVQADIPLTTALKWLAVPLLLFGEYQRLDQKIGEKTLLDNVGSPEHESNQQAYRYVRDSLPVDARLAYHHPLILGLYARKKSMHWARHEKSEMILEEFRSNSIQYLLVNNWLLETDDPLKRFMNEQSGHLTTVWQNERNILYRLQ